MPAVTCDHLDHGVYNPMGRTSLTKLDRAQPQRIAHGHRRHFAQMFLQEPVGSLQPAQSIDGQPLRPRAVIRWQMIKRACLDNLCKQPTLAQNLIQQKDRAAPRCDTGFRHL